MIAIAIINLVLYGFIAFRAVRFFYEGGKLCREADKTIISGVGAMAVLFIIAQATQLFVYPTMGLPGGTELLYGFIFTNGIIDLTIVQVTLASVHRRGIICLHDRRPSSRQHSRSRL